jgi:hypothetical protein
MTKAPTGNAAAKHKKRNDVQVAACLIPASYWESINLVQFSPKTSWGAMAVPSSATDAPPGSKDLTPHIATIRDRPQGLFHALSGGYSSKCYGRHSYRYLLIRRFCCLYARFCCPSCETRLDLDEVARNSPTQTLLDPACLCGQKKNAYDLAPSLGDSQTIGRKIVTLECFIERETPGSLR